MRLRLVAGGRPAKNSYKNNTLLSPIMSSLQNLDKDYILNKIMKSLEEKDSKNKKVKFNPKNTIKFRRVSLACWNINGYTYEKFLFLRATWFDIIILVEPWKNYPLPNDKFKAYKIGREVERGFKTILEVFVKTSLESSLFKEATNVDCIPIKITAGGNTFFVLGIYLNPCILERRVATLSWAQDVVKKMQRRYPDSSIFIAGDFNINLFKVDDHKLWNIGVRETINKTIKNFTIHSPYNINWTYKHKETLIDFIISWNYNSEINVYGEKMVTDVKLSDHILIVTELDFQIKASDDKEKRINLIPNKVMSIKLREFIIKNERANFTPNLLYIRGVIKKNSALLFKSIFKKKKERPESLLKAMLP